MPCIDDGIHNHRVEVVGRVDHLSMKCISITSATLNCGVTKRAEKLNSIFRMDDEFFGKLRICEEYSY